MVCCPASAAAFPVDSLSAEEIAQGTALVEEMLQKWADKAETELHSSKQAGDDEEDVVMTEADGDAELEKELELLQSCFAEYRDKFDETPWTRTVLRSTY